MMRGHNRQHFPPKVPGTNRRSYDVPTAIIYRPARSPMTSARRPRHWVLEFEPAQPLCIEPLMGYTSSEDPYRAIRLKFPDRESAIDFAEQQDWSYIVRGDEPIHRLSNRWRGRQAHQLYKGADIPGAHRIFSPQSPVANHQLHRGADVQGASDVSSTTKEEDIDPVLLADLESFPASDPPAWTGVTVAGTRSAGAMTEF